MRSINTLNDTSKRYLQDICMEKSHSLLIAILTLLPNDPPKLIHRKNIACAFFFLQKITLFSGVNYSRTVYFNFA